MVPPALSEESAEPPPDPNEAAVFSELEVTVRPSPADSRTLALASGEKVVDFDVSPRGREVLALVKDGAGQITLRLWEMESGAATRTPWQPPAGFAPGAIAMHPQGTGFFLSGKQGEEGQIVRVETAKEPWKSETIYRTKRKLRRLLVGPRPFVAADSYISEAGPWGEGATAYRLFFGLANDDGSFAIRSVNERGGLEYQVIGTEKGIVHFKEDSVGEEPTPLAAPYALPMSFLPPGNRMLWQDKQGCFQQIAYDLRNWLPEITPLADKPCAGSLTATPNGLGLIHWQSGADGVTLYLDHAKAKSTQAQSHRFLATPSSVPDGKGLVGLIETPQGQALVYVPIQVPLADVVNAALFVEEPKLAARLDERGGLFRNTDYEQMYQLYESELYDNGAYSRSVASRPYLITTDIFWEVFASAFEGLFVVQEKQQAIPAFWEFVAAAHAHYQTVPGQKSLWAQVFATLHRLHTDPKAKDPELANIRKGTSGQSAIFGRTVDYGELKPRSHYTMAPEMQDYFRAFKYLTLVAVREGAPVAELEQLPAPVKAKARAWIDGYLSFIAPPRAPLVWAETPAANPGSQGDGAGKGWIAKALQEPGGAAAGFTLPPYAVAHPGQPKSQSFPLSWGFDNEVILSVLYHPDWPAGEQIVDAKGNGRLLPSLLELPAALGSALAWQSLEPEFARYPNLKPAMERLRDRSKAARAGDDDLYQRWTAALAVQWADGLAWPGNDQAKPIWEAKRLQTGLASWSTLRHATLLVNERAGAEAGEAGFEEIVMRPPRGYVEPDPATLEAIAGLFDAASGVAGRVIRDKPLLQGVQKRLAESAAKTRDFARMAQKERKGEGLTPEEYNEILYVARVVEHHFLLYKSLANPVGEYAIANPDPMPKIADVAGGTPPGTPLLHSAVGSPLEWLQIVPHFGRRQIVKGAVYSWYAVPSPQPIADEEWREMQPKAKRPAWVGKWME